MNGAEPTALIMLVGGVVLFVAALVCLFKRFSAALVVTLFIISIVMIGFPRVQSFKIGGAEVNLGQLIEEQEKNPNNPETKARLEKELVRYNSMQPSSASPQLAEQVARANEILNKNTLALNWAQAAAKKDPSSTQTRELVRRLQLKNVTPASADRSVPPQEASKLTSAVSELSGQPNLLPSRTLHYRSATRPGEKEEAATNLHKALKQKPNVTVDPNLRALIAATPHQP